MANEATTNEINRAIILRAYSEAGVDETWVEEITKEDFFESDKCLILPLLLASGLTGIEGDALGDIMLALCYADWLHGSNRLSLSPENIFSPTAHTRWSLVTVHLRKTSKHFDAIWNSGVKASSAGDATYKVHYLRLVADVCLILLKCSERTQSDYSTFTFCTECGAEVANKVFKGTQHYSGRNADEEEIKSVLWDIIGKCKVILGENNIARGKEEIEALLALVKESGYSGTLIREVKIPSSIDEKYKINLPGLTFAGSSECDKNFVKEFTVTLSDTLAQENMSGNTVGVAMQLCSIAASRSGKGKLSLRLSNDMVNKINGDVYLSNGMASLFTLNSGDGVSGLKALLIFATERVDKIADKISKLEN